MKICLPNNSKQTQGGGWTFRRNLIKGGQGKFEVVDSWKDCDIVLITGATMTDKDEIREAKKAGKKVVFRVDNLPKDSRNRGTAFSRMALFAQLSDYLIYQSGWARDYVGWWLENKVKARAMVDSVHSTIYNGVDTEIFNHIDKPENRQDNFLIVQYNRDENKRNEESFYQYYIDTRDMEGTKLFIVGNFSPEKVEYNFDFFNNEKFEYLGVVDNPKRMADIMRQCKYFYFPAFADASSNTLTEALACGCKPLCINEVGGSMEILRNHYANGVYTIQEMAEDYSSIFNNL